jgi:hypothetical protein
MPPIENGIRTLGTTSEDINIDMQDEPQDLAKAPPEEIPEYQEAIKAAETASSDESSRLPSGWVEIVDKKQHQARHTISVRLTA